MGDFDSELQLLTNVYGSISILDRSNRQEKKHPSMGKQNFSKTFRNTEETRAALERKIDSNKCFLCI